jgi:capsular polysaccharide biosynthesis protein
MRKQTTILIAVAAFALSGLVSAFALLPERQASDQVTLGL